MHLLLFGDLKTSYLMCFVKICFQNFNFGAGIEILVFSDT